jgi:hypothetical protein
MPGPATPNLGLTVPTVGGDANIWGTELNNDLAIIDGLGIYTTISVVATSTISFTTYPELFAFITTGAAAITVNIPSAPLSRGRSLILKKLDSGVGSATITPAAGTIDGFSTWILSNQYQFVRMVSDGANWNVVAKT